MNKSTRIIALALLAFSAACSKEATQPVVPPDTTVTPPPPPPPPPGPVDTSSSIIVAAGNIARCQAGNPNLTSNGNANKTAMLIDSLPTATVLTLGNAANPWGTQTNYDGCYAATWGRFKSRTFPAIGSHDFDSTTGVQGYMNYWGARGAGVSGSAYYSTDVGSWHVVVLNTEAGVSVYQTGSEQHNWLAADLAANASKKCTIVAFARPRFYSGTTPGGTELTTLRSLWSTFEAGGVDVILNGGKYQYERMAPMNAAGAADNVNGMRQFNAGMGGETGATVPTGVHPMSQKLLNSFGVLKLTLRATSYDWAYLNMAGAVEDSGTGTCH